MFTSTERLPYKAVILCGGQGTRMREETEFRPKPLVEVGGKPILWHIMKHYSRFGVRDFVLCLGYKGEMIVDYFESYHRRGGDYTLVLGDASDRKFHQALPADEADWRITFAWTGLETMTGGRIRRIRRYVEDELFFATYGDGISDVDITELLAFHQRSGHTATVTGVHLPTTFGIIEEQAGRVMRFREKPVINGWINGGFFVFNRDIFEHLRGDEEVLEDHPMKRLVELGRLGIYRHDGFWRCMDTFKDVQALNFLWNQTQGRWKAA